MNTRISTPAYTLILAALFPLFVTAQIGRSTITTGASFLLLSPDARTTGVAEAGTGLVPDANSVFTNAAKLNFAGEKGLSFSYTPWMRQLVKDEHLGYLTAFHRLSQREALGMSIKYLDMGEITFRDEMGNLSQRYNAGEISIDASYSRLLGDHFAMALTARYIHSNLGSGAYNGLDMDRANAFAMDVGLYSEKSYITLKQFSKRFAWGINLTNIGTKLNYTNAKESFLPMNLRMGVGYGLNNDPDNRLTLLLDVTKLLVPSRPQYRVDEQGNVTAEIEKGKDPDRSVPSALFTSFFDAPGGFSEELSEFTISGGFEFCYYRQFFIRSGYFYENPAKGNRQHFAAGVGLRVKSLQIDIGYLTPMARRYSVRNELKFTLSFHPMDVLGGEK
ncbi:type IX secretion system outer membrane channel protein PorV [Parapedobacter lycopersici]|uniref:type IX secretion system outer membrane channel protein PorV n=1 Tax=Parapedobacter lycopersici TaxID=1864939 RepID=UPI00214DC629|nr:type IX secretion system outer membrane channel protein PorV [Parapedobacter lycopersici]